MQVHPVFVKNIMDNDSLDRMLCSCMVEPGNMSYASYPDKNNILDIFRDFLVRNLEEYRNPDDLEVDQFINTKGIIDYEFRARWILEDEAWIQVRLVTARFLDMYNSYRIEVHKFPKPSSYSTFLCSFWYPGTEDNIENMQSILDSYLRN